MRSKRLLSYGILLIILLIAGYLRLYRINDYMGFLGDEGRDALVVKRMIVDGEFTLLGPITSVGLMHLGPMYYYFMAPFLWLTQLNPVGPAIMVALFSLATIILIWKMLSEFFDERAGLIAALLYGLSPLVITHSHSSWNPNILPFWGLLLVYGLLKVIAQKKYIWLVVVGAAFGVSIQLHYVALVYAPIVVACLLLIKFRLPLKYYIGGLIGGIATFSPYIVFELRHKFINTLTIYNFITRGGDAKTFGLVTSIYKFWDLTLRLFWRLVIVENAQWSMIFLLAVLAGCIYLLKYYGNQPKTRLALSVFLLWYAVGIGVLSFYTGIIYDYYLMFAFPLPFLLIGIVFSKASHHVVTKIVLLLLLFGITWIHLQNTPISREPNRLAAQAKTIADFILTRTDDEPYNFALLAPGNSDHAYRYFLEIDGQSPVVIKNPDEDPLRTSVTQQLFVVCEESICSPLGHPLWEIAGFGRAEIANEWQVELFKVYQLVPYQGE